MRLHEEDRVYLAELLRREAGHVTEPPAVKTLETRLTVVARHASEGSLRGLMKQLRSGERAQLHRVVAEALTIKETSFFRDVTPFDLLRTRLLPELVRARAGKKTLRLWSAACSTGQEAYSLAMLLRDSLPAAPDWDVQITGTDISREACEKARRGEYGRLEINRGLPVRMLLRHFERAGENWRIKPELRAWTSFQRANLCGPLPLMGKFDLVLLRNVLLYLAPEDRAGVLRQVAARMAPDGVLLLGAAEQAEPATELFRVEFEAGCYFYRLAATEAVRAA